MATGVDSFFQSEGIHKNSVKWGVLHVDALSQNRAKPKNSTKVYAANNTGKAAHMSSFC